MKKIGIAGFGFVGSAVFENIIDKINVTIYDKYMFDYSDYTELLKTDFIFVCLPTVKTDKGLDNEPINTFLRLLSNKKYQGIVIIKSTIHPEYLDIPDDLKLIANPEFLNQNTSNEDFKNQKVIYIGGMYTYSEALKELYIKQFDISSPEFYFCTFVEALTFKYVRNIRLAYEIAFQEMINDVTGNYRKYQHMLNKLPVEPTKISICKDGKHGFGGACLIKDLRALNHIFDHPVLTSIEKYNKKIRV